MKIVQLNVAPKKGMMERDVPVLQLVAGLGIQDDYHFGQETDKQVSFIWKETLELLEEKGWNGFCNCRFVANMVLAQKPEAPMFLGQHLQHAECVLRVTAIEKDCHALCAVYQQIGRCCEANKSVFFAEVICEGLMKKGEEIK